ncbi:hypothetical protein DFP73DRAFT_534727 [Morchella snyderi]|nr:hypothetical protein DFP73DRAFT_534727 [Morchella snyderi]
MDSGRHFLTHEVEGDGEDRDAHRFFGLILPSITISIAQLSSALSHHKHEISVLHHMTIIGTHYRHVAISIIPLYTNTLPRNRQPYIHPQAPTHYNIDMTEIVGTLASISALIDAAAECYKFFSETWIRSKEPKIGNELGVLEEVLKKLIHIIEGLEGYLSQETLDLIENCAEDCITEITNFQEKMDTKSKGGIKVFLSNLRGQQMEKKTLEFFRLIERRKSTLTLILTMNQLVTSHAFALSQSQPDPEKHAHTRTTQTESNGTIEAEKCPIRSIIEDTHQSLNHRDDRGVRLSSKSPKSRREGEKYTEKGQKKISPFTNTPYCPGKEPIKDWFSYKASDGLIPVVVIGRV